MWLDTGGTITVMILPPYCPFPPAKVYNKFISLILLEISDLFQ
jgi:hypothetical protein